MLEQINVLKTEQAFPLPVDLNGVAVGIARLQKTYSIKTSDLADGIIRNAKFKSVYLYSTSRQKFIFKFNFHFYNTALNLLQVNVIHLAFECSKPNNIFILVNG